MSETLIYKAIWAFLVLITLIYDTIRSIFNSICLYSLNLLNSSSAWSMTDKEFLEQCKAEITKYPKHFNVIIGTEKLRSDTLAKIAVYALISDIDYISFYDTKGELSLDHIEIPQYISSHKMQNGRILWTMPSEKRKSGLLKYKNGFEKSIQVVNLSYNEGKPLIAEVCKDLHSTKLTSEAIKNKESLSERIDDSLRAKLDGLPDPELSIIFSKYMCTYGLLPWHTGFTEFHLIETGDSFGVRTFANVLYKFSKCEQRFGK